MTGGLLRSKQQFTAAAQEYLISPISYLRTVSHPGNISYLISCQKPPVISLFRLELVTKLGKVEKCREKVERNPWKMGSMVL